MSSRFKRSRIAWLIATGLAAILLALLLVPDSAETDDSRSTQSGEPTVVPNPAKTVGTDPSNEPILDPDLPMAAIRTGTPEQRLAAWQTLRSDLLAAPVDESTAFILAFLASGERVPMGQAFVVGRDGSLLSAPDLRTLLLDTLGTINPEQADREARRILTSPDDPDDWAISLRIVSQSAPPDDPYLVDRVLQHLQVEAWLEDPVISALQAYDAAVYIEAPDATHRLVEIADSTYPPATRFAARLALERKAETQFATVGSLIAAPEALPGEPELRASLMARGDVRVMTEREIIESYLLTLPAFEDEALAFALWFPNYNQQVSDNLITTDRLTSIEDRMAQDRATLVWIHAIRAQPAFAETLTILQTIEDRLNRYLAESPEEPNDA